MDSIEVADSAVMSALIGGEWYSLRNVTMGLLELARSSAPDDPDLLTGEIFMAATIQGGPRNGYRIVVPIRFVSMLRIQP